MLNQEEKAKMDAQSAHGNQKREGGDDYICHPMFVKKMLEINNCPIYTQIIGLLHDVLEDTYLSADYLKSRFNNKIVDGVQAMTIGATEGKDVFYSRLKKAVKGDNWLILVKFCDKYHNLTTSSHFRDGRLKRYCEEIINFVLPIGNYVYSKSNNFLFKESYKKILKLLISELKKKNNIEEKKCTKCKEKFPLTFFVKDKNKKDGYHQHCYFCIAEYKNKYNKKYLKKR